MLNLLMATWLVVPTFAPAVVRIPRTTSQRSQATAQSLCADGIRDQANPSYCIDASSVPALGSLFPLSENLFVSSSGRVGIGTTNPGERLHVEGTIRSDGPAGYVRTNSYSSSTFPSVSLKHNSAPNSWIFYGRGPGSDGWGDLVIASRATSSTGGGTVHIAGISGDTVDLNVDGDISTRVLTVRGADLAEGFDVVPEGRAPGTLLIADPTGGGQLLPCSAPYQTQVIGAVSGARGVRPGLHLVQEGVSDGETRVAMVGQVYVWCTDESGPIVPGDLITTSSTRGHGMRVADPARAFGAVAGKACGSLKEGVGLVLVIVNLQ